MSNKTISNPSTIFSDAVTSYSETYTERSAYSENSKLKKGIMTWNLLKTNDKKDNDAYEANEHPYEQSFNKTGSTYMGANGNKCYDSENTSVSNHSLPKRSGAASVLYKSCIYIFGGYRLRTRLNDLYKYDIIENKWNKLPNSKYTPSARENNPAGLYENRMYIYGGYQGNKKWLNDFYFLNLDTHKWTPVEVKEKHKKYAPPNLFGFALAVEETKGILYFFGGYDGNTLYNKMYAYHIKQNKWIYVNQSGDIPSPRSCANSHIVDGYFYLFGGYDGTKSLNSLYQYHLETGVWTKIKYNINHEERLQIAFNNQMETNSSKESQFYQNKSDAPSPRYFAASFYFNRCIYILGGYDGQSKRLNDFYQYDIYQRTWTKIGTSACFTGRSSMNVHLFKNVVYCIAGYDGKNVLNDVFAVKLENIFVEASSYMNDFKLMINNPRYSDVVFVVQNRQAYACKALLSARCLYFFNLFGSHFVKKGLLHHSMPIIINDISYDTFLDVLNYLYTDQLNTNYPLEKYINLLLAAIKFNIFRLVQLCEMFICDQINDTNVLDITILSYKNDCRQLCRFCLDYLVENKLLDDNKINKLVNEPHLLAEIYRRSINS